MLSKIVTFFSKDANESNEFNKRENNREYILEEIANSESEKKYENLVFSGAGMNFMAYTGALKTLKENNVLYDEKNELKIKNIAGCGTGAIIASYLALGCSVEEICSICDELYERMFEEKLTNEGENIIDNFGEYSGKKIMEFIENKIEELTGSKYYTIDDLYKKKNIRLVINATNVSKQKKVYFYPNNNIYREVQIREAIMMSMCVPIIFEPYLFRGSYFVDGGIYNNYPINVFDYDNVGNINIKLDIDKKANFRTLGLNIINESNTNIKSLLSFGYNLIQTIKKNNETNDVFTKARTIIIKLKEYSIDDKKLDCNNKMNIIECGEKSAENFLKYKVDL